MREILYSLVIFVATTLGAMTGVGGGAIIKPSLDMLGRDTVADISIYSTVAVFAMCLSSIYKHRKSQFEIDRIILLALSLGSVVGGILGEGAFRLVVARWSNQSVTLVQSSILLLVLTAVFVYTRVGERLPSLRLRNRVLLFVVGLVVGTVSIFIGIGGGPLNILVLMGLLSLSAKEATPYSIAMIFFAQVSKILQLVLSTQRLNLPIWLLLLLVFGAISGGQLGTALNQRLSNHQVHQAYSMLMLGLLIMCIFTIIKQF